MNDLLETIGGGQRAAGVYRVIVSALLAVLTIVTGLLVFFLKDEFSLSRSAVDSLASEFKSHVGADVGVRDATSRLEFGLDTRITKIETSRDDFTRDFVAAQTTQAANITAISTTLVNVERELSQIEGHLSIAPSANGGTR